MPLGDEAIVAAIVARHPNVPGLTPDDVTRTVRTFVRLRHYLQTFVDATSKHARVDCDLHAHESACARVASLSGWGDGYVPCSTVEFLHDGAVADLHVLCADSNSGSARVMVALVLDALDGVRRATDRGVEYRYSDEALLAKARADVLRDLGRPYPRRCRPSLRRRTRPSRRPSRRRGRG